MFNTPQENKYANKNINIIFRFYYPSNALNFLIKEVVLFNSITDIVILPWVLQLLLICRLPQLYWLNHPHLIKSE